MFPEYLFTTSNDNEKKRRALLQSILNRHNDPYLEQAEDIKRKYPKELQAEYMRELHQKMVSDPMIKGITSKIAEELTQKGVVFIGVDADGSVSYHTKTDVFK
ncbi:hypothetical protein [Acinetobacter dispersus]|uniref:hypothetical protein n=1 Tax=Acinetobacter dispersus TaxID=70348 RepID=UPI001F4BCC3F|nr:hypothetical protein [Acinetobacter dispersus]MCH7391829.1 hypothetical protein [Acinetobacter dispersus]